MTELGHVNIQTDRLEETVSFYRDLLGLRPGTAATRPESARHVWLFDNNGHPCIHLYLSPEALPLDGEDRLGVHHVAFNCDNPERVAALLEHESYPYQRIETAVPGVVQFNLTDPNGLRIELTFGHENFRSR